MPTTVTLPCLLQSSVALANAQNMYSHHAIDYGYQINAISCVKGHEILSNVSKTILCSL